MAEDPNRLTKFWHELKRRKVVRVIVAYVTIAVVDMQQKFENKLMSLN